MKYIFLILTSALLGYLYGLSREIKVDMVKQLVADKNEGKPYTMYQGTINGKRSVCLELDRP